MQQHSAHLNFSNLLQRVRVPSRSNLYLSYECASPLTRSCAHLTRSDEIAECLIVLTLSRARVRDLALPVSIHPHAAGQRAPEQ
jgi:hypothetical protein